MRIAIGTHNRGKYTFPNIPAFPEKVLLVRLRQLEKYVQRMTPERKNKKVGIPSVGILATPPKITVKTSVVTTGGTTNQNGPRIVCL